MGRAETIAKCKELEAEHRTMILANRYLKAGKLDRLPGLGIPPREIARLVAVGGYSSAEILRMRDTIRYYRVKSRRKLWLPEPKGGAQ